MKILRRTADGKAKLVGQGFNITVPQDMADYVVYYDSADTTDHSHAKPGVPTPTDHGWYRVYKSGWCEQGGQQMQGKGSGSLPVTMNSVSYVAFATNDIEGNNVHSYPLNIGNKTTTGFTLLSQSSPVAPSAWLVIGMSA